MGDWDSQESGSNAAAAAVFAFDNQGLLLSPDSDDNPDNEVILKENAGVACSFVVWNVGQVAGSCQVDIYVDDNYVKSWNSGQVSAGSSDGPGMLNGLGRYSPGRHLFAAYVNPGGGYNDAATNDVDIAAQ